MSPQAAISFPAWALVSVPVWFFLHFLIQIFAGNRFSKMGFWLPVLLFLPVFALTPLLYLDLTPTQSSPDLLRVSWLNLDTLHIDFHLRPDAPQILLYALVTVVSFLVHLFSAVYMQDDPRLPRYWAFLSLFTAAMLLFVLMQDLLMTFMCWELVGVSSWFLIGFWYERPAPAKAAQKAFILNRIGDAGFLMGLGMLVSVYRSLNLHDLHLLVTQYGNNGLVQAAILLIFLGVAAKSAQFPLQVWLPDAMEGPTPASALIHAATMVAAGVFLLFRLSPLILPETGLVLALVGAGTAALAAVSALTQTDIKRVLAYSTISQLGLMVVGIGVGAPEAGFFHLITHAFFKAGLFLGAGAVLHVLHGAAHAAHLHTDAQDLRHMGGLGRRYPVLAGCYVLFAAALAGLPLTGGFLSKESIFTAAHHFALHHSGLAWAVPVLILLTVLLTGFYISRQAWLIWGGRGLRGAHAGLEPKLPPVRWPLALPLVVLAALSLHLLYSLNPLHVSPERLALLSGRMPETHEAADLAHILLPLGLSLAGMLAGLWSARREAAGGFARAETGFLRSVSRQHFYIDRLYDQTLGPAVLGISHMLARLDRVVVDGLVNRIAAWVLQGRAGEKSLAGGVYAAETRVLDPAVNGVAGLVRRLARGISRLQAGQVQRYLIWGLLLVLFLVIVYAYFVS